MDEATFQTIEALAGNAAEVDYWDETQQGWVTARPTASQRRQRTIVHESGSIRMGNLGPLDELYRLYFCDNVASNVALLQL